VQVSDEPACLVAHRGEDWTPMRTVCFASVESASPAIASASSRRTRMDEV
jgi:hypothetical protein